MNTRTLYFLFIFSILVFSCKSNSEKNAQDMATGVQNMVKEHSPGTVSTSTDGYTMTATIDGKDWKAADMYPPDKAGLIVGENNGESISLPYYDRRNFLANTKTKLKGVDMRLNDEIKLWSGINGEMEITKSDANMAEGKFSFTAKGFQSDKTIEVTNGFFRILFK
ncbi:MAG: hypothetical protein ABIR31_01490 [Ginsengibacter sp.]